MTKTTKKATARLALMLSALCPLTVLASAPVDIAQGTAAEAPSGVAPVRTIQPSLSLGAGIRAAPVYEGAKDYAAFPVLALKGVLPTEGMGTFRADLPEGVRWELPSATPFGFALLGSYDPGRKERIRTLNGHNDHLAGMGDLGGTPVAGVELSWGHPEGRLFIRGLQSLRSREYGGEDVRGGRAEAGLAAGAPLSPQVTARMSLFVSWADRDEMMSRYGVTREQAQNSTFSEYHAGGGLQDMNLTAGADWHWSPDLSLDTGLKVSRLLGDTPDSPLVDRRTGAGVYTALLYTF